LKIPIEERIFQGMGRKRILAKSGSRRYRFFQDQEGIIQI
jgi:hypothetical protein